MEEAVELRLYSVGQLKSWLYHGADIEGLTEELIDKGWAWAIVNNPYVNDEMQVVSALFVNGGVAAYTYVFPDLTERPHNRLIYWNTTLYVNPKYEGRGYAYCVIAQMCELYGNDYFDLNAAEASVENLRYQGLTIKYVPQYVLKEKAIHCNSLKGCLAYVLDRIERPFRSRLGALRQAIAKSDYTLRYIRFIDDDLYEFIRANSSSDLFLRKQQTFNWILQYPVTVEAPVYDKVARECNFSSYVRQIKRFGVEVLKQGSRIGFVLLYLTTRGWSVKYLYGEKETIEEVYLAIAEHLITYPTQSFSTTDKELYVFLSQYGLYPVGVVIKKSFAFPSSFDYDEGLVLHGGDGDNFI